MLLIQFRFDGMYPTFYPNKVNDGHADIILKLINNCNFIAFGEKSLHYLAINFTINPLKQFFFEKKNDENNRTLFCQKN